MKKIKYYDDFINEDNFYQSGKDPNSIEYLKPLLKTFKEKISGSWEFQGYVINYHNEKSGAWAQITLADDPPTKLNVLIGNLTTDPFGKRAKEQKFFIEDIEEVINFIQ